MPDRILSDQQCQCLDQVLQSIAHTRELASKCKDCGLDMTQIESELDMQQKLAEGIKRNFAPGRA